MQKAGNKPLPSGNRTTLKIGWAVALTFKEGIAPLRCYVGKIEAMDDLGLRLTLVDWFLGEFLSYDLFVTWANVECAYVCTNKHDLKGFGDYAGKWQTGVNGDDTQKHGIKPEN